MSVILLVCGVTAVLGVACGVAAQRTRAGHLGGASTARDGAEQTDMSDAIRKHLAIMNGWAHTLEERWEILDDADKRMAIGIIRRTSEEAVERATELAGAPTEKLSA